MELGIRRRIIIKFVKASVMIWIPLHEPGIMGRREPYSEIRRAKRRFAGPTNAAAATISSFLVRGRGTPGSPGQLEPPFVRLSVLASGPSKEPTQA